MVRRAIGIMVHQSEVKAAYLTHAKGMLSIEALETIYLKEPIDEPVHAGDHESPEQPFEDESQFEINDPYIEEDELDFGVEPEDNEEDTNATLMFSLINRLTEKRVRIAFSMPPAMVRYGRTHLLDLPQKKKNLARRLQDKLRPSKTEGSRTVQHTEILNEDDSSLPMVSQFPPPLYDLLQEVNTFTGGKLQLQLLDTNELALAGLVRDNYRLFDEDLTAIVHIESDFSRIIFLRGRNLFRISQMINEPFNSPDLLSIVHSKLIYEQDESDIPDLTRILISGKGASLRAREFFAQHYPDAEIGYIYSKKMRGILSEDLRGEIFSEFAVPIALAAKVLEPRNPNYLDYNLMPDEILDRQRVLKLAPHGYALLLLLALVAFGSTYKIVAVKTQIRRINKATQVIEAQLDSYRETLDRVTTLDAEIRQYRRLITLADSLGQGHDEMLSFLNELNDRLKSSQSIWIKEILKRRNQLNIKGLALSRSQIPVLSSELGNADLKRVTRTTVGSRRVFAFELEKRQQQEELPLLLGEFPLRPGENPSPSPPSRQTRRPQSSSPRTVPSQVTREPETAAPVDGALARTPETRGQRGRVDRPRTASVSPIPQRAESQRSPAPIETADSGLKQAKPPAPQAKAEHLEEDRATQAAELQSRSDDASPALTAEPGDQPGSSPAVTEEKTSEPDQSTARSQTPASPTEGSEPTPRFTPRSRPPSYRAPTSGQFTIEIGTYPTRDQAVLIGKRFADSGFGVFVQLVLYPDRKEPMYRLVLGAFSSRNTAVRAAAALAPRLPQGARVVQVP